MKSITRVIPVLLLRRRSLVKTVKFRNGTYVGDPINTVRIFNEREVDELVIVDIEATPNDCEPQFDLIEEIASEAFMPFTYGGGINRVEQARELFRRGAEKVIVNSAALRRPALITELAEAFGSQSVVVSIDCKKKWLGGWTVFANNAREKTKWSPDLWAQKAIELGAGEILLTSVEQDGTFAGFDQQLTATVSKNVEVPVIACGGAGELDHLQDVVKSGGADAAAAGSLFVYQGKNRAVLINYPTRPALDALFQTN